ncbi:MAG TPA: hypothetical protein VGQ62_04970 [Chloroflexota bacterium]|nr:hypothetical protein [Chloroflexota bacterium]
MDAVAPLAGQLVQILTPFLPYLARAGEAVAPQVEAHGWEFAQQVWARLNPSVQGKPAAQEAVADLAAQPADEDAQAALRVQLKKLLAEDAELQHSLSTLLSEAHAAGTVNVDVSGNRSVGVGRDVRGSTIITGDQNQLNR